MTGQWDKRHKPDIYPRQHPVRSELMFSPKSWCSAWGPLGDDPIDHPSKRHWCIQTYRWGTDLVLPSNGWWNRLDVVVAPGTSSLIHSSWWTTFSQLCLGESEAGAEWAHEKHNLYTPIIDHIGLEANWNMHEHAMLFFNIISWYIDIWWKLILWLSETVEDCKSSFRSSSFLQDLIRNTKTI